MNRHRPVSGTRSMLRDRKSSSESHVTVRPMFTGNQYTLRLQPGLQLPNVYLGQSEPKDPMVSLACFLNFQTPEGAVGTPLRQSLCI